MSALTQLELEALATRNETFVRLSTSGGKALVLPCVLVSEDRVVPSDGTNGMDRVEVRVDDNLYWVERRDVCEEDGSPARWEPSAEGPSPRPAGEDLLMNMSPDELRSLVREIQSDYRSGAHHESSEDIAEFVRETLEKAGLDVSPQCDDHDEEDA